MAGPYRSPLGRETIAGKENFSSRGRRCLPSLFVHPIYEGQYLGYGLIEFLGNRFIDIQLAQYLNKSRIVRDGDIMLPGQFDDLFGDHSPAFGNKMRRPVLSGVIFQYRRQFLFQLLVHRTEPPMDFRRIEEKKPSGQAKRLMLSAEYN